MRTRNNAKAGKRNLYCTWIVVCLSRALIWRCLIFAILQREGERWVKKRRQGSSKRTIGYRNIPSHTAPATTHMHAQKQRIYLHRQKISERKAKQSKARITFVRACTGTQARWQTAKIEMKSNENGEKAAVCVLLTIKVERKKLGVDSDHCK